jgi:hypothetical protein
MKAQLDVLREVFEEWLRIHVTWLNYGTGIIDDELQELAAGFDHYCELGNRCNMGFYPTDDWLPLPAHQRC